MLGVPEFFVLAAVLGPVVLFLTLFRGRAKRFGYPSTVAYLRAAPRSDAEKRDAAGLALKGLMLCALGVLIPPFVLGGVVPLFYGGRKVVYASMGLGLVDDASQHEA